MLCQNCNHNEANVRYTQIINGEKKEMFLCDKCSKELGIDEMKLSLPIDFSSFFGELLNEYDSSFMPLLQKPNQLKCDKCNMTYNEFMELGKFGCDHCYDAFSSRIDTILKRIQGSNRYTGKKAELNEEMPKEIVKEEKVNSKEQTIQELKQELKRLVQEEKYEEAARVRDEIKKLEVQD